MWPLIMAGRLLAVFSPLVKQYRVFYFFSFYHIGGAEKVHAQVAQATGGSDCIIFFTRRSDNNLLRPLFEASGCEIRDLSRYTDNKWLYPLNIIMRGLVSAYINRQRIKPLVFNGQNNFGYKLSPWINKHIPQVELIHSLNSFSFIRIPFLPFITRTVMISMQRIEDHMVLYREKKIPASFDERINYISNAIEMPAAQSSSKEPFTVLYAGRGGEEKRLHLIAAIAEGVHRINPGIIFEMMGDVSQVLDQSSLPFIIFNGNVSDPATIDSIYQRASLLVMTSATEGFPMVVIEAMARGNVILSTAVGDLPRHIRSNVNGYLFSDTINQDAIVREGIQIILALAADPVTAKHISENNSTYARENFGIGSFNQSYRELFRSLNNPA